MHNSNKIVGHFSHMPLHKPLYDIDGSFVLSLYIYIYIYIYIYVCVLIIQKIHF